MNHLMLDLETLDTENTAVFPSFAAVQFDIETGEIGEAFYQKVTLKSALDAGLTIGADTIKWWMSQDLSTRLKMFDEAEHIITALTRFSDFFLINIQRQFADPIKIWGNSASFDCGILKNGYRATKLTLPWDFRNERCYRSFVSEFPDIGEDISRGEAHNPIDDCLYQIKKLCAVWKHINHKSDLPESRLYPEPTNLPTGLEIPDNKKDPDDFEFINGPKKS